MGRLRRVALSLAAFCYLAGAALLEAQSGVSRPDTGLAWLYPASPATGQPIDTTQIHQVPHSRGRFTLAQVNNPFAPADWHPDDHPDAPEVVLHGRKPELMACGYCHLVSGKGRPENAAIAGLPERYIVGQLAAMKSNARANPRPDWRPTTNMHLVALAATRDEAASAAAYFSKLRFKPTLEVIEEAYVPRVRDAAFVLQPIKGAGTEEIGERIVEYPLDFERHELRDGHTEYIAYVPPGSLARGKAIALTGGGVVPPCVSCHGPGLLGNDTIPPLAGRYPSYLVRQLLAFKSGARSAAAGQPMVAVVAGLSLSDMIAAAAYAASLKPGR